MALFQDSKFASDNKYLLGLYADKGGSLLPMAFAVVFTKVA
jgi:hypothetical protein